MPVFGFRFLFHVCIFMLENRLCAQIHAIRYGDVWFLFSIFMLKRLNTHSEMSELKIVLSAILAGACSRCLYNWY